MVNITYTFPRGFAWQIANLSQIAKGGRAVRLSGRGGKRRCSAATIDQVCARVQRAEGR